MDIKAQIREKAEKEYDITKEHCQKRIDDGGGVCGQCGGVLTPIETVNNSGTPTYWAGCEACSIFHWGTPPIVHEIARKLVIDENYVHYSHMFKGDFEKDKDRLKYWYDSQIGGTCNIVSDVLRLYKPELSQSSELKKENERLKGLIKEGFILIQQHWGKKLGQIDSDWQQFKTENNL